jgi:hypothetical protein
MATADRATLWQWAVYGWALDCHGLGSYGWEAEWIGCGCGSAVDGGRKGMGWVGLTARFAGEWNGMDWLHLRTSDQNCRGPEGWRGSGLAAAEGWRRPGLQVTSCRWGIAGGAWTGGELPLRAGWGLGWR